MYKNILLKIAYDGTDFQGWQELNNGQRTVAGELEKALEELTGRPVRMVAAGRTDAGVHAEGQLVNFLTNYPVPGKYFYYKLRPYLPEDLLVYDSMEVPRNFHARFQSREKTYRYQLIEGPFLLPQDRHHYGLCSYPLDEKKIRKAMQLFEGKHNFSAFSLKENDRDPIRTITDISLDHQGKYWIFRIRGDSFLRRQIRILIGALCDIGRGRLSLDKIPRLLDEGSNQAISPAYPAAGLTLEKIEFSWKKSFPDKNLVKKIQDFNEVFEDYP